MTLTRVRRRCYGPRTVVNKVIIVGNLGRDPEVRFTPSGRAMCKFSVATTEKWTDQQGQKQERTEWHNIVVWGKQAETCGQYLAKGRQVFVEGSIHTRNYDDKDGNKKYITEITARDVRFLGGGGGTRTTTATHDNFSAPAGEDAAPAPEDDDIPF
ncbi:MAG: single-stranded DNA-binding protein [Deltaproteobacteria bacterium]|nr:single-stranded DNA-binding protein [Deltaproteobacteria bacterium]MBI3390583.1 single-stranded DNA-binding protein [Deltaproteobacteria bacterium]